MKRTLTIIGLGVAGIVLAVALSVGAFALVGDPLSEPATTIQVPASPTPSPSEDRATPDADEPALDALGNPILERIAERRSRRQQRHRWRRRIRARRRPRWERRRTRLRRLTTAVPAGQGPGDGSIRNVAEYGSMSDNLHRRDIWGDDPEERDASEVVAEIAAVDPESARRWHDHPAVVPFKVVGRFIAKNGRRIAITVVGVVVLLAGLALLVLPGPGWLLIFVGLSILGTEYVWAQRMLRVAKEQANKAKDKVLRRKQAKADRRDDASADGSDVS